MTKNRLEEINQRFQYLRKYITFLKQKQPVTSEELINNLEKRGAIERYFQLAAEAVLDVANLIIAEYRFRTPTDYKDCLLILGEEGVLEKKFAQQFSSLAGFRNALVHDYVKIDYQIVADRLNHDLGDFDTFAKQVASFLT